MIDVEELKEAIATALPTQLGTYTFRSTGGTTPALRVDDGADPYDEEPAIDGLEVVIVPALEVPISMVFGGYQQTFGCSIVLKQWDVLHTTLDAMELVLGALNALDNLSVGNPRRMMRSPKIGNIEVLTIPVSQSFLYQQTFDD